MHESPVHGFPSSQFVVCPGTHAPLWQVSPVVHRLPSSQSPPSGLNASAGQLVLVPLQASATSQEPEDPRHTVPALPAGCVHVTLVPSHTSLVHTFPSPAHAVPLDFFTSV